MQKSVTLLEKKNLTLDSGEGEIYDVATLALVLTTFRQKNAVASLNLVLFIIYLHFLMFL